MKKHILNLNFAIHITRELLAKSEHIQVIIGPRQVGKTTTILETLNNNFKDQFLFYNADQIFHGDENWLQEIWSESRRQKKILVIDEIQKISNWPEVIKFLWDEDQRLKKFHGCVLLGSSSLALQKGLTESLAGRYILHPAYHWNFSESQQAYGLSFSEYIKYGGYPGSYPYLKDEKNWKNYVKNSIVLSVIEKDILQFHTVKKPALFKQVFEIIMSYPAQEISYTKLLGQIQDGGNVDLIKYYLSLYEGSLLIKTLEKFSLNSIKTKSSSPKILPLAPCFYYLENLSEYSSDEFGRVFEVLVGMQLVRTDEKIYYWRERNDEVDFILKKGKKIFAIEVKSGRKKSSTGIKKFCEKYPTAKPIFITRENYFLFEEDPIKFLEA